MLCFYSHRSSPLSPYICSYMSVDVSGLSSLHVPAFGGETTWLGGKSRDFIWKSCDLSHGDWNLGSRDFVVSSEGGNVISVTWRGVTGKLYLFIWTSISRCFVYQTQTQSRDIATNHVTRILELVGRFSWCSCNSVRGCDCIISHFPWLWCFCVSFACSVPVLCVLYVVLF